MTSRSIWLLAALFLIDAPRITPSRADVPPPRSYVEECTVEKQQQKGEYCTYCGNNRVRRDCDERFAASKLPWTRRCKTWGATRWTEVWCTPWTGKNPPKIPPPPKLKPKKNSDEGGLTPVF